MTLLYCSVCVRRRVYYNIHALRRTTYGRKGACYTFEVGINGIKRKKNYAHKNSVELILYCVIIIARARLQ